MNTIQETELLDEVLFHFEKSNAKEADPTLDATVSQMARRLAINVTDQDVQVMASLAYEQLNG